MAQQPSVVRARYEHARGRSGVVKENSLPPLHSPSLVR
jgi:hypothetical protein